MVIIGFSGAVPERVGKFVHRQRIMCRNMRAGSEFDLLIARASDADGYRASNASYTSERFECAAVGWSFAGLNN